MSTEEKYEDLGKASYWKDELKAAEKELEKFREQGKKVIRKFLDKGDQDSTILGIRSLNLFHSNVVTLRAMLYGQNPKVDVSRRYEDANDDVARVAGEILERCLNNDIQFTDETFSECLRSSLDDFLLVGLGQAKIRYEPIIGADEFGQEMLLGETAPVDYINWRDFLWSAGARTWPEVRWVSFATYVTKKEAVAKWGDKIADQLSYTEKKYEEEKAEKVSNETCYTKIQEIWCKESKHIYWYSKDVQELLGKKADPLQLMNFFPCPQPLMANTTTTCLVPKADYTFSQDLYNDIDILTTRIAMLTKAVKVVGVYDKQSVGVQRMLNEAVENQLIPVDNWAQFAEKGGIKGQVDWLPIEEVVSVIQQLEQQRGSNIQLLYQVTGMSDILRGATDPRETKGAQELKSKYASIRVQAMQDLFAKFASDIQRLKAEIMGRHYQAETLIKQSNISFTVDAPHAPAAVQLIKDPKTAIWRIQIRTESIAMVDYAQLKSERMEYIMGVSQFMQSAAPLAQLDKSVTPTLLELLKWGLAGFKGSQQIEGVLDKAISQATESLKQPPPPPPPDPKVEATKMKIQADQQAAQAEEQRDQSRFQQEMAQSQQKFQQEMQQAQEKFRMEMMTLFAEVNAKKQIAEADATANIIQKQQETAADIAAAKAKPNGAAQ